MPCFDPYAARETRENSRNVQRLDELTEILCSTCKTLTAEQISKVAGLSAWWKDHQEQDRIREEEGK